MLLVKQKNILKKNSQNNAEQNLNKLMLSYKAESLYKHRNLNKIKKSRVVTLVTEPPQTIPLLLRSINNL